MKKRFINNDDYFTWFNKNKDKINIRKSYFKDNEMIVDYIKKDGKSNADKSRN